MLDFHIKQKDEFHLRSRFKNVFHISSFSGDQGTRIIFTDVQADLGFSCPHKQEIGFLTTSLFIESSQMKISFGHFFQHFTVYTMALFFKISLDKGT